MFKILNTGLLMLVLVFLVLVSGCNDQGQAPVAKPVAVGQMAPDFTLTDMQGKQVSLAQFRGKVVLINFWATWCPPCREEMPSMEELHRKLKDKGLVLLALNVDKEGYMAVSNFLSRLQYSFPVLLDTDAKVQNLYQVFRFPETFIVDRNGVIVEKVIGARSWLSGSTFQRINFLLNG